MRLHELKKGDRGRVTEILSDDAELEAKLREIGFAEDDDVEIMYFGPFGGRPICTRLNQTLIALRLEEANAIKVEATA